MAVEVKSKLPSGPGGSAGLAKTQGATVVGSFAAPCGGVIVLCHGDHSGSFGGGHHDGDRVDGGGLGGKKKLRIRMLIGARMLIACQY